MDTRFLETFVAVVENGSIAEAARRLNLTAAAVTQRIQVLQGDIGVDLLSRVGRTVRPTQAGMAILGRARNFLAEARDFKSIAMQGVPVGEFRLGVTQTVLSGILPDILSLLTKKYPQIAVTISRQTAGDLYAKVLEGELDAAILPEPSFAMPKTCDWRLLRREPLIVLAPASESLRDPHAILAARPFIRQSRNTWAGRLIDAYLRRARIRPHELFEVDGFDAIAIMVNRGLGVSLVHDWAPPWPEGFRLAKLPVPRNPFERRIGILWMRAGVRSHLVRLLLELAELAFASPRRHSHPARRGQHQR
jgi:DNA-binding transcriptional LysR family regulator